MKNIIIGTAGHIDHGKTSLIRALTGRDTDRLKEEKERGISIELGFTYFDLPSGRRAGIIDVPGHERFIGNMLAGAGGIDVVILAVAADEGVMPQTREHLSILSLLHVKKGIIALTKMDMVDGEWLEMIVRQIRDEVKDTFLGEARIIPLSSVTGEGMDELIREIDRVTEAVAEKDAHGFFRLPVDRAFTITGFGTVATGTLISGSISEGERVEIYPAKLEGRVRSLQVHGESVKTACAGQRVAINIAGVRLEEIRRGDVLAKPGSLEPVLMLDARLELLAEAGKSVGNRDRLRLHHGASEMMCRVVLLDREELKPGESAFVQLRLEEQLACCKGDRFVIRTYSPMLTIGGGTILDANPPRRRRYKEEVLEELKVKETGDPAGIVAQYLQQHSGEFPEKKSVIRAVGQIGEASYREIIEGLAEQGRLREFKLGDESYALHQDFIQDLENRLSGILEVYHRKNPLKPGMLKEELRSRLFEGVKSKLSDAVLGYFEAQGRIKVENQYVSAKDFKVQFSKIQAQIRDILVKQFAESRFNPPKPGEISGLAGFDKGQVQTVYNALIDLGTLVKVEEDIVFSIEAYREAVERLEQYVAANKAIQLGQFRDLLGTSRKYAVALLDHFDRIKLTKRVGDNRVMV